MWRRKKSPPPRTSLTYASASWIRGTFSFLLIIFTQFFHFPSHIYPSGASILYVFNVPKSVLEVFRIGGKGHKEKDFLPPSQLSPTECIDFSNISSFVVSQSAPEKDKSSVQLHMEHHVNLYSGSTVLMSVKLMHLCQLDPISEILRLIVEGDPHSYFLVSPCQLFRIKSSSMCFFFGWGLFLIISLFSRCGPTCV